MMRVQLAIALTLLIQHTSGVIDPVNAKQFHWVKSGSPSGDDTVKLTFWVKLTHTQDLKEILNRVSDPTSPEYGHYMSKAQVDALTKPTSSNIGTVKSALHGYKIESLNDGAIMSANVPVSFAEDLLGGKFVYFCRSSAEGSSHNDCVLRNPTASVSKSLRDACDIITPLDDPLPSMSPLPGPIIEPTANRRPTLLTSMAVAEKKTPTAGCCFAIGYGAYMKPCCLKAQKVDDIATCDDASGRWLAGGGFGHTVGECPASAEEAAHVLRAAEEKQPASEDGAATAHLAQSLQPLVKAAAPATRLDAAPQEAKSRPTGAGCCFQVGYGAMMRPCCLETQTVSDIATCQVGDRIGGRSGYRSGGCPATAQEAVDFMEADPIVEIPIEEIPEKEAVPKAETEAPKARVQMRTPPNMVTDPPLPNVQAAGGCCFSFGYGSMMKPCCLEAQAVPNVLKCKVGRRMGGASSFSLGRCPANADEAADMERATKAKLDAHEENEAAATSSGPMMLMVVFLAVCGAVLGGVFIAARRRGQQGATTPFLRNDGAE